MGKCSFLCTVKNKVSSSYHNHLKETLSSLKHSTIPPHLFHFERHSVAKAAALGLFINFLPLPLQSVIALFLALLIHANIPLAIGLTWINNPFTFIPINLFMYKVGCWVVPSSSTLLVFPQLEWQGQGFQQMAVELYTFLLLLGKPYIYGVLLVSISAASLGFLLVHVGWLFATIYYKRK